MRASYLLVAFVISSLLGACAEKQQYDDIPPPVQEDRDPGSLKEELEAASDDPFVDVRGRSIKEKMSEAIDDISKRDLKIPITKGEAALVIIALVLVVLGTVLVRFGVIPSGLAVLAAGVGLLLWRLGTGGLNFNPMFWEWSWIFWIILISWGVAKLTGFTRIDDWVVGFGSLFCLIASFVGRGLLGSWNPLTPTWWTLEVIWAILVAQAIWTAPPLQARRGLQGVLLFAGWYLLGMAS